MAPLGSAVLPGMPGASSFVNAAPRAAVTGDAAAKADASTTGVVFSVSASEILGDAEQREAYDHLLDLAQFEQVATSQRAVAARIHTFTSAIMALAGIAVMTAGSYLLFMQMSAASLAPAVHLDRLCACRRRATLPSHRAVASRC